MVKPVREAWTRAAELFPLNGAGVVLAVLSIWGLWRLGLGRIDLVVLTICAVALILLGLSLFSVVVGAAVLFNTADFKKGAPALHLECGYPGRTGFSVPSLWWLPLATVDWTWKSPQANVRLVREWGRITEQVTPMRRGESDEIVRMVTVADAFGLCSVTFPIHEKRRMRTTPSQGALKQMHVVQGLAGGDALSHPDGPPAGDRFDMRHYAMGDPIRFVLWKVFAKSRTLVIRTPERAISPVQQTVAYLVSSAGDEPAAGAARVAIDAGAFGADWVLGADGIGEPARQKNQAMDLIVRSARASETEAGAGLTRFLTDASPGMVRRAVVFVPATPGPWVKRVLSAARAGGNSAPPLDFVVCTDGIEKRPKRGLVRRFFFAEAPAPQTAHQPSSADDVAEVVRALSGSRGKIMVVDRVAGRVYPQSHLKHLGAG